MLTFMFAVLGSILFWIGYSLLSLVGALISMKICTKDTYKYIKTGKKNPYSNISFCHLLMIIHLLIWPIILTFCALGFAFKVFFKHGLRNVFKLVDKAIPSGFKWDK